MIGKLYFHFENAKYLTGTSEPNSTDNDGAATADHGSSTLTSIFGTLNELQPLETASSIIIIIISVAFLNYIVEKLSSITKDTPFEALLVAIEHELMIVGCTAFIFKIFINLYPFVSSEWYHALEYADILVPIVAFVFCFQGFLLIVMTILQTNIWNKGYHLLLEEILDQFYSCHLKNINDQKSVVQRIFCQFMVQEKMRFRIYRLIFCDQYGIIRNSLAFDSYVLRVYEKYLLDIIKIRPLDWLFVIGVVLLNWGRDSLTQTTFFGTCDHDDIHCLNEVSLKSFTIIGYAILFGMVLLSIVSFIYNGRLLTSKGVTNISDYPVFLKGGEEASQIDPNKHRLRYGSIFVAPAPRRLELNLPLMRVKLQKQGSNNRSGSSLLSWVSNTVRDSSETIKSYTVGDNQIKGKKFDFQTYLINNEREQAIAESNKDEIKNDVENMIDQQLLQDQFQQQFIITESSKKSIDSNHYQTMLEPTTNLSMSFKAIAKSIAVNLNPYSNKKLITDASSYKSPYYVPKQYSQPKKDIDSNPLGLDETDKKKMTEFESKMEDDIANIFLCSRPDDYFHVVKLSLMVMSLYSGLWLTNFCTVALDLPEHRVEWLLLSLTPIILGSLLYIYIIKCAALLKAMSFCDTEVIAEVLEQTEASNVLAEHLRDKVLARLNTMGKDPTVELRHLFEELDSTHDHRIDKKELESLLNDMGIQFSRRTWEQMFKRIDRDMDQQVTLDDLFMFIFPDNDIAQIEENVRIKTLQFRIRTFSARYHDERKSFFSCCSSNMFLSFLHRKSAEIRYKVSKVVPNSDEKLTPSSSSCPSSNNNHCSSNNNNNHQNMTTTTTTKTKMIPDKTDHRRASITEKSGYSSSSAILNSSPCDPGSNAIFIAGDGDYGDDEGGIIMTPRKSSSISIENNNNDHNDHNNNYNNSNNSDSSSADNKQQRSISPKKLLSARSLVTQSAAADVHNSRYNRNSLKSNGANSGHYTTDRSHSPYLSSSQHQQQQSNAAAGDAAVHHPGGRSNTLKILTKVFISLNSHHHHHK